MIFVHEKDEDVGNGCSTTYRNEITVTDSAATPSAGNRIPRPRSQLSLFADGPSSPSVRRLSSSEEMNDRFANLELDSGKSPISIVHEIMASRGSQIQYDLVSVNGQNHCPEFVYRAESNNITGYSKKEAKKNAAISFLVQIKLAERSALVSDRSLGSIDNNNKSNLEVKTKLNYIGMLQELCVSRKLEFPVYEFFQNKSEEPWFAICRLHLYKSKGKDKTKQSAKVESARLMYEHIKGVSQEEITFFNSRKDQIQTKSIIDLRTLAQLNISDSRINMIASIIKSKKPCISNLKKCNSMNDFKISYVDILKKIAEEEGFNVMYTSDIVNEQLCRVTLELSSSSVLTHSCLGTVIENLKEAVAYDVLSYFKLLLKD